jgi:Fe-S cluster assembly protein SufB
MPAVQETVEQVRRIDVDQYKYGFETKIESEKAPKGLSEDTIRFISAKKNEPAWMLAWRLEAYKRWLTMREPTWARVDYPKIDYQNAYYYSAPKKNALASLDEVDPEILKTYEKLGIPLREQEILAGVVRPEGERRVAVDAVFDSVSVATTFKEELKRAGVIFMPISEALREHPDLVKKYLGSVVPVTDNFFATLNSAVFSDGSFVYVPPGVRCPMELSTYFRINEKNTGQFERTLIIADKGAYVSAATAAARARKSPGRRSRPARPLPGNIRAVSCAATTRAVSSIRSPFPTAVSRSTAAPRCCTSARIRPAASSPRASPPENRTTPIAAACSRTTRRPMRATSPIATRC